MTSPADDPAVQDKVFFLIVLGVSLAFACILWPFYEAILWAIALAILFEPLYRRAEKRLGRRRSVAALATVAAILILVILPFVFVSALIVQEASGIYDKFRSGAFDPATYFHEIFGRLPSWLAKLLGHFGLTDLGVIEERLSTSLAKSSQLVAAQAVSFGQNAFQFIIGLFIMLYLLFFLLRDGNSVIARIKAATPLPAERMESLSVKFAAVIRATVKGNLVMAAVQGLLGGLVLWLLGIQAAVLWGSLMAFFSLLPPSAPQSSGCQSRSIFLQPERCGRRAFSWCTASQSSACSITSCVRCLSARKRACPTT